MTDYVVIDDCGTTDNKVFHSLADARAYRESLLSGPHDPIADHVHVAILNYVPQPGAWKVEVPWLDRSGSSVHHFRRDQDDEVWDMWDQGRLDVRPEWVPNYEWSV